jgi:hypothetical protein
MACIHFVIAHLKRHWILIFVGAMLLGACSSSVGPEDGGSMPFPVTSLRGTWPLAVEEAREWRADAYVADADVSFTTAGGSGAYNEVFFGFESPTDRTESLLVACMNNLCIPMVVSQNPELAARHSPIMLEDFELDAKEALDISLQFGAKRFTSRMSGSTISSSAKLSHMYPQEPEKLTWRASYVDLATKEYLYVIIDATTGELVEVME